MPPQYRRAPEERLRPACKILLVRSGLFPAVSRSRGAHPRTPPRAAAVPALPPRAVLAQLPTENEHTKFQISNKSRAHMSLNPISSQSFIILFIYSHMNASCSHGSGSICATRPNRSSGRRRPPRWRGYVAAPPIGQPSDRSISAQSRLQIRERCWHRRRSQRRRQHFLCSPTCREATRRWWAVSRDYHWCFVPFGAEASSRVISFFCAPVPCPVL